MKKSETTFFLFFSFCFRFVLYRLNKLIILYIQQEQSIKFYGWSKKRRTKFSTDQPATSLYIKYV
jgi:hypothetical protein